MTKIYKSLLAVMITLLALASLFFSQNQAVTADNSALEATQTNSNVIVRKTYNVAGQPVAQRTYSREDTANRGDVSARQNEMLHFLYTNHLGSVNTMIHSVTGEQTHTRFLPFGGIRSGGDQFGNLTEQGFTGHHENREIGLTYMNARFYVPGIGRFASADIIIPTLNTPQHFNRYTYSVNNPINLFDPTGRYAVCIQGDTPTEALEGGHYGSTV